MPEAGRVIAGVARGRRLAAPGAGTRPFTDRVKQTLFAVLGPDLEGARALDLFAGSGAGGIEALSRGAASCDFVERDAAAAAVIRENLSRTGLEGPAARVVRRDALAFIAAAGERYDLVLLDPPYGDPVILDALRRLGAGDLLAGTAVVAVKRFWRATLPGRVGRLELTDERRIGETVVSIYRLTGSDGGPGAGETGESRDDPATDGAARDGLPAAEGRGAS